MAPEPFETLTYTDGAAAANGGPRRSIDESTADREGLELGDTLRIAGEAGVKGYEIAGHPAAWRHLLGRARAPRS